MVRAAEALMLARADDIDRRALARGSFDQVEESRFMMDFVYAGNLAADAIDMMQYAIGSSTISDHNPIQRFARDARVALTHGSLRLEPVAEIHGRQAFGFPPFQSFAGGLPGVKSKTPDAAAAVG
jgi:alkylation response protein AidB-like acyl-CoA dehydrogenase